MNTFQTPSQLNALILENDPSFSASVKKTDFNTLPQNQQDILIKIEHSTINYKDALAITNKGKIVKGFPFIPGIDFSGVIVKSDNQNFKVGDKILATGHGIGERHFGGLAEYIWAAPKWLTPLPSTLSLEDAMFIGTGGFTAMLCVDKLLQNGMTPDQSSVVVTGASGGVGSFAVAILHQLGYKVTAISSKEPSYLKALGATEVIPTDEFSQSPRPLDQQKWGGAVDAVGGDVLAKILSQMNYGASVASCGLAADFKLNTTVMPFILRGVNLLGIDSVYYPQNKRTAIWEKLGNLKEALTTIKKTTISLEEVPHYAKTLLENQKQGRVVVKVNK